MNISSFLPPSLHKLIRSQSFVGLLLVGCAAVSLLLANTSAVEGYLALWNREVGGHPLSHWIDEGLMAVFFLLVGLELKYEFLFGSLHSPRQAMVPVAAAVGGMAIPAAVYLLLNWGEPSRMGFGIPMATDIAFVLAVLAVLGRRIPAALKVFLTTLAVVDDIGAIVVIAVFYSSQISISYLMLAVALFGLLVLIGQAAMPNCRGEAVAFWVLFLVGGVALWLLMMRSGVHATLSGILLAVALPAYEGQPTAPAQRLQHKLHEPVFYGVLPLFVLANTAIPLNGLLPEGGNWSSWLSQPHVVGIMAGLLLGKPCGILLGAGVMKLIFSTPLPEGLGWRHLVGGAMLGGIGFTMSIFVAALSFEDPVWVASAKLAIFISSILAAMFGALLLIGAKGR